MKKQIVETENYINNVINEIIKDDLEDCYIILEALLAFIETNETFYLDFIKQKLMKVRLEDVKNKRFKYELLYLFTKIFLKLENKSNEEQIKKIDV